MFILSLSYRPLYTVLLLRVKYGIVNSSACITTLKVIASWVNEEEVLLSHQDDVT